MLKRLRRTVKAFTDHSIREEMGFAFLRRTAAWVSPRYRFNWGKFDWWHNDRFTEYLERFNELDGMNTDRRWTLYQLARLAADVPGDTAECGVFRGASSYLICRSFNGHSQHRRTHFVFDSFEGVSKPQPIDGTHWTKGDLTCPLDVVKQNLQEFDNISWHKGWIPQRFADVTDRRFSFVHIDVDLYEPTRDSIQFFYPRLNNGGIIICDDYGFTTCPGATRAVDEFLTDKSEKMIALPCGGGFLIKGCHTSAACDV
jgi:hypothetical protein